MDSQKQGIVRCSLRNILDLEGKPKRFAFAFCRSINKIAIQQHQIWVDMHDLLRLFFARIMTMKMSQATPQRQAEIDSYYEHVGVRRGRSAVTLQLKTCDDMLKTTVTPEFSEELYRAVCDRDPGQSSTDSPGCAYLRRLNQNSYNQTVPPLPPPHPVRTASPIYWCGNGATSNHVRYTAAKFSSNMQRLVRASYVKTIEEAVNTWWVI